MLFLCLAQATPSKALLSLPDDISQATAVSPLHSQARLTNVYQKTGEMVEWEKGLVSQIWLHEFDP